MANKAIVVFRYWLFFNNWIDEMDDKGNDLGLGELGISKTVVKTFEEYLASRMGDEQWLRYHEVRVGLTEVLRMLLKELLEGARNNERVRGNSKCFSIDPRDLGHLVRAFQALQLSDPMFMYVMHAGKLQGRKVLKRMDFGGGYERTPHSVYGGDMKKASYDELKKGEEKSEEEALTLEEFLKVKSGVEEVVSLKPAGVGKIKSRGAVKGFKDRTKEYLEGLGDYREDG